MLRRAAIVGAGVNGLSCAAVLAQAGWQVDVFEVANTVGGSARSAPVFGSGTIVDLGAAAHPFGVVSPAFRELKLEAYGLKWAHSRYPLAHPLPDGSAAVLMRDLQQTAALLGDDRSAWTALHGDLVRHIDSHVDNVLQLPRVPHAPLKMARFGAIGMWPAMHLGRAVFRTEAARALLVGSAAHTIAPLTKPPTAAFGLLFSALGMTSGWPIARGGSQAIVDALFKVVQVHGGQIHSGVAVTDLRQLGKRDAVILNLTPAQVLKLDDVQLSWFRRRSLSSWRYGPASFKVDYLLSVPIPWTDPKVAQATTVHLGGTATDIALAEAQVAAGKLPENPFVLVCQQQIADPSRARNTKQHVVWAYAHVPRGVHGAEFSELIRARIRAQIERFAPGFGAQVIAEKTTTPAQLEAWNSNIVGGDIAGGAMSGLQAVIRQPHRLGAGVYLASGSTAPGAGVHGMPGYLAAKAVLRDFGQ